MPKKRKSQSKKSSVNTSSIKPNIEVIPNSGAVWIFGIVVILIVITCFYQVNHLKSAEYEALQGKINTQNRQVGQASEDYAKADSIFPYFDEYFRLEAANRFYTVVALKNSNIDPKLLKEYEDKSIKSIEKAVDLSPLNPQNQVTKGAINYYLGNKDIALNAFEKAISTSPHDPNNYAPIYQAVKLTGQTTLPDDIAKIVNNRSSVVVLPKL